MVEGPRSETVFKGTVGEVEHIHQPDGRIFEIYHRPPGVRVIVVDEMNNILMTREHRHEQDKVDLRFPGGKVFNAMQEMHNYLDAGGKMIDAIIAAGEGETRQEAGVKVEISADEVIEVAVDGATVDWDLHYILVRNYEEHPDGQELEAGEEGIESVWMTIEEIVWAAQHGEMSEMRSVGVLFSKVLPLLER